MSLATLQDLVEQRQFVLGSARLSAEGVNVSIEIAIGSKASPLGAKYLTYVLEQPQCTSDNKRSVWAMNISTDSNAGIASVLVYSGSLSMYQFSTSSYEILGPALKCWADRFTNCSAARYLCAVFRTYEFNIEETLARTLSERVIDIKDARVAEFWDNWTRKVQEGLQAQLAEAITSLVPR